MFLKNKYTSYYYSIVYKAQARETSLSQYTEKHHIIPKSLGGTHSKDNLVKLTAREHFVCHLLLLKMLQGNSKYKMAFALNRMLTSGSKHSRYIPSSRLYELSRKYRSEAISLVHKGVPESAESNLKRSIAQKGIPKGPFTEEHRKNLSLAKKGIPSARKGIPSGKKGLSYEDIYGVNKADILKKQRSEKFKGRQFSNETKELWSKNRKGKNTGGENSNAKSLIVFGILYSSMKEASEKLGISIYKLKKIV